MTAMRVLVGYDGSASAAQACAMAAGIDWPSGSDLVVISVYQPVLPGGTMPGQVIDATMAQGVYDAERAAAEEVARQGVDRAARAGKIATAQTGEGRPASAIIEAAVGLSSDLVVVGRRGLSPFESALIGSVSAELVDHAPCPVLVARGTSIARIVLAFDGSPAAQAAVSLLVDWPIFQGSQVRVVTVAELHDRQVDRLRSAAQPTAAGRVIEEALGAARGLASSSADRLTAAGLTAEVEVRRGDPAHNVLEVAAELQADLIVLGTRGLTGLRRMLVGSVARKVLQLATCSVLVVHAPGTRAAS